MKVKEVTVSVGITKQLQKEFEFIRLDMSSTLEVSLDEDSKDVYAKAWEEVETQLANKLRELHGKEPINKPLP